MSKEIQVKIPKAEYGGELPINGFTLSCAVLEDGTRLFSERSLANAFGIKGGGAYWQKKKEEGESAVLPEYLSANYLEPFITNELRQKLDSAVSYIAISGTIARGIDATVLPDICDVYVAAKNKGITNPNLVKVADTAYLLMKGFATVGIIALVDEATGYQYARERDELQKILKAYIAEELLPWQQQFPDIFYKEIFRLNGWDFTVKGIKQRPGIIGKWTNHLIYEQLPKGVLAELKKKTPKGPSGKYSANFHQSLTPNLGQTHLQNQLQSVITLFQISDNWTDFSARFNTLVSRRAGQLSVDFTPKKDRNNDTKKDISDFDQKLKGLLKVPPPKKGEHPKEESDESNEKEEKAN